MRLHFISRLALLIGAAFLVVVTQVWTGTTLEWLIFAGGVGMIALAGAALVPGTSRAQRVLDGVLGVLGVWTVIEALVFSGAALTWISFGGAVGAAAIAVAGLLLHELRTERVVHELTVTAERAPAETVREPLVTG